MNISDSNNIHECTSCQVCALLCKKNAISYHLNSEGFYRPTIDNDKCVDCGGCKSACYKYLTVPKYTFTDDFVHYAVASQDSNLLKETSSGGIGDILCEHLINKGYICVGVAYDYDNDIAVGKIAYQREETFAFRGSKYIQSYSYPAFKKILDNLQDQKIAFFGTPCQIFALDLLLKKKKKREQCILVDFYCHGCPSINVWKKYINKIKIKNNIQQFKHINFRDKSYGWGRFHIKATNGIYTYISPKINDEFYTLFFSNMLLNDSCSNCEIRNTLISCDIRIGDFWGKKYLDNTSGMSLVSINPLSTMGMSIFEQIKHKIKFSTHNNNDCIPYQSVNQEYNIDQSIRHQLFESLSNSNADLSKCISILWKNYNFKQKCFHLIRNIIFLMPHSIVNFIKKIRS